jgi:putative transposase
VSAFIDQHRASFGVEPICRELEVSDRATANAERQSRAREHAATSPARRDPTDPSGDGRIYGAWRCWRQLRKDGVQVARCTVERLMRGAGLVTAMIDVQ